MARRPKRNAALFATLASAPLASLFASSAWGQPTYTWDATSNRGANDGSGAWNSTALDWWNGSQDVTWTSGDVALFGSGSGAAGTVTVSGTVTAAGIDFELPNSDYTITGGTISFGTANGAIVAGSGTSSTISSLLAGSGGINVSGGAAITLENNANSFTGGLSINGAGTQVDFDGLGAIASNAITFNGGTLDWTISASSQPSPSNAYIFGSAGGTIQIAPIFGSSGYGKYVLGNANQFQGSGTFTKTGAGNLSLNGSNAAFTGAMIIDNGVVTQGNAQSISSTSPVTLNGSAIAPLGAGLAELVENGSNESTLTDSSITINNGYTGIIGIENKSAALSTSLTNNGQLVFQLGNYYAESGNYNLTLSGSLSGSGTIGLISAGGYEVSFGTNYAASSGQTLTLSGNDSGYSGTLSIGGTSSGSDSDYVLAANSTTALGSGSVTLYSQSTLSINVTQSMGALNGNGGIVALNGNALTVASGGSFSGVISDNSVGSTGSLTVSGGSLALGGANTYAGATTVNSGGTLNIAAANALNSGNSVTNNGSLMFSGPTGTSTAGNITGNGTTSVASAAQLVVSNSFTQDVLANSGSTTINGTGAIGQVTGSTGTLNIGNGTSNNTVQLTGNVVQSMQKVVTVATGSTLDIGSNSLVISYGALSNPIASYQTLVNNGYQAGAWTGGTTDITSSWVAAENSTLGDSAYGVALVDGNDNQLVNGPGAGKLEITPALIGDDLLAGTVNFASYGQLEYNYGKTAGATWDEGDFNYDGAVNFADYGALEYNYSDTSALTAAQFASMDSIANANGYNLVAHADGVGFDLVAVPEPATVGLLVTGGLGILNCRRRTKRVFAPA